MWGIEEVKKRTTIPHVCLQNGFDTECKGGVGGEAYEIGRTTASLAPDVRLLGTRKDR